MTLFFFLLAKAVLASLPTSHFVALRSPFPVRQTGLFMFFAEACTILKSLRWPRQQHHVCHFSSPLFRLSLCPRPTVLSYIFPFTSNSLTSGRNCLLSPLFSGYNESLDTNFFRVTTWLTSWPGDGHYSCLLQSLIVSILLPLASAFLFSWTGGVLSNLNSSTHRSLGVY